MGAASSWLDKLARLVYSRRTYAAVFEPQLQDLRDEHHQALLHHGPRFAWWVRVRGSSPSAEVQAALID